MSFKLPETNSELRNAFEVMDIVNWRENAIFSLDYAMFRAEKMFKRNPEVAGAYYLVVVNEILELIYFENDSTNVSSIKIVWQFGSVIGN